MDKYCCFFCPANDYSEKRLEDTCPTCGRTYGHVLSAHPRQVGDHTISRFLARGFYGAAYVSEKGVFRNKYVVKISPKAFYNFFSKPSFEKETDLHRDLSQGAEHVVGIVDRFDAMVTFSDAEQSSIECHVAVLDYVEGDVLSDYIAGRIPTTSATVCQIAIDLLRLRAEFEAKQLNHNDLHANNLIVQQLPAHGRRQNAINDGIRVMAIDLGSLADSSKSTSDRHGDLRFIAMHVDQLLARLLAKPTNLDDRDFRTALALQGVAHGLLTDVQNARHPNIADLIAEVEGAYYRASHPWRPWSASLQLKSFADHYNAQTLVSSDVPRLLVDPQNRWLDEVSKPGPQIITGMRGCGKTMLLRALDIHAQAVPKESETTQDVLNRLESQQFVGLFVSAQRLLDLRDSASQLEERLTRLFVHYALQAARALLHLRDLGGEVLVSGSHVTFGSAIADVLEGADELRTPSSVDDLEARLERLALFSSRDNAHCLVRQAPGEVFSHLAERFRACTSATASSTVLFLLDDVSSRYLPLDRVEELLSALLFQSPVCAFKFTSEWQTIELGLQSPGRIHPIREGRDVAVFDLGADVYETISSNGKDKGNDFVAQILQQRAKFHTSHPRHGPKDLLGDVALEQVAREIATSGQTSTDRKYAYRGLSCLTSVCVGDLGDVIKLYEEIIKRGSSGKTELRLPIDGTVQADCFKAISSRRIFDLNRRRGFFKDHALAFAEAARELLVRSFREAVKRKEKLPRLRQYSSLYVRVTSEDRASQKQQIDLLRELIDAGVFVYTGGSPRTKTKDSDPIRQFKLSYRKIYGLASHIGLADRDRFELSSADLEEWLANPHKSVLLRNQIKAEIGKRSDEAKLEVCLPTPHSPEYKVKHVGRVGNLQGTLFDDGDKIDLEETLSATTMHARPIDVRIRDFTPEEFESTTLGATLVGLGFEDRTLASNEFLAEHVRNGVVYAVGYSLAGHSDAILRAWTNANRPKSVVPYDEALAHLPEVDGLMLVDVTGLSKPIIFGAVRRELQSKGRVLVCLTSAANHYPLEDDLKPLFDAQEAGDPLAFLQQLSGVLKGENGPYMDMRMLDEECDLSRNRALIAFASAKHERLFSLLDRRDFDYVEILASDGGTLRSKVAVYAAEFLCQNFQNSKVTPLPAGDLLGLVSYLDKLYLEIYGVNGANVEIGLTGTKLQAVAAAVISARRKVAQAWYLAPSSFDDKRFSTGVQDTRVIEISIVPTADVG